MMLPTFFHVYLLSNVALSLASKDRAVDQNLLDSTTALSSAWPRSIRRSLDEFFLPPEPMNCESGYPIMLTAENDVQTTLDHYDACEMQWIDLSFSNAGDYLAWKVQPPHRGFYSFTFHVPIIDGEPEFLFLSRENTFTERDFTPAWGHPYQQTIVELEQTVPQTIELQVLSGGFRFYDIDIVRVRECIYYTVQLSMEQTTVFDTSNHCNSGSVAILVSPLRFWYYYTGSTTFVAWNVSIPENGIYNLSFKYSNVEESGHFQFCIHESEWICSDLIHLQGDYLTVDQSVQFSKGHHMIKVQSFGYPDSWFLHSVEATLIEPSDPPQPSRIDCPADGFLWLKMYSNVACESFGMDNDFDMERYIAWDVNFPRTGSFAIRPWVQSKFSNEAQFELCIRDGYCLLVEMISGQSSTNDVALLYPHVEQGVHTIEVRSRSIGLHAPFVYLELCAEEDTGPDPLSGWFPWTSFTPAPHPQCGDLHTVTYFQLQQYQRCDDEDGAYIFNDDYLELEEIMPCERSGFRIIMNEWWSSMSIALNAHYGWSINVGRSGLYRVEISARSNVEGNMACICIRPDTCSAEVPIVFSFDYHERHYCDVYFPLEAGYQVFEFRAKLPGLVVYWVDLYYEGPNQAVTQPSSQPSNSPSKQPSKSPSSQPSNQPSGAPSQQPSSKPSRGPSSAPSERPSQSVEPSSNPADQPSHAPVENQAVTPPSAPSASPSISIAPFGISSSTPSNEPSCGNNDNAIRLATGNDQTTLLPSDRCAISGMTIIREGAGEYTVFHPGVAGGYIAWDVLVPQTGWYMLRYLVSSPDGGDSFEVCAGDLQGPCPAVIENLPKTDRITQASWVSHGASLVAGYQTLSLRAITTGWSLYIMEVAPDLVIPVDMQPSAVPNQATYPVSPPPTSNSPVQAPTRAPAVQPSSSPIITNPTLVPTSSTTSLPTLRPTVAPVAMPSQRPTPSPLEPPTQPPTAAPNGRPTVVPVSFPTASPMRASSEPPTPVPVATTTQSPVMVPSNPTGPPSVPPLSVPADTPIVTPTHNPTSTFPGAPIPTGVSIESPTSMPTDPRLVTATEIPTSTPPTEFPHGQPSPWPTEGELIMSSLSERPSQLPTSTGQSRYLTPQPTLVPTTDGITSSPSQGGMIETAVTTNAPVEQIHHVPSTSPTFEYSITRTTFGVEVRLPGVGELTVSEITKFLDICEAWLEENYNAYFATQTLNTVVRDQQSIGQTRRRELERRREAREIQVKLEFVRQVVTYAESKPTNTISYNEVITYSSHEIVKNFGPEALRTAVLTNPEAITELVSVLKEAIPSISELETVILVPARAVESDSGLSGWGLSLTMMGGVGVTFAIALKTYSWRMYGRK